MKFQKKGKWFLSCKKKIPLLRQHFLESCLRHFLCSFFFWYLFHFGQICKIMQRWVKIPSSDDDWINFAYILWIYMIAKITEARRLTSGVITGPLSTPCHPPAMGKIVELLSVINCWNSRNVLMQCSLAKKEGIILLKYET